MFALIPVAVDVPLSRWPWANFLVLGTTVLISVGAFAGAFEPATLEAMILRDGSPGGLIGHMFLHGGILHLAGNMLFLWVFGNAVCAKVGNGWYLPLYLGLGLAAGAGHLIVDGAPAIGASGAVTGLVGAYLVLYPLNDVRCWYFAWIFWFIRGGSFQCSSFWMILYWLAWDVLGFVMGSPGVAYSAHLAGFAAGFGTLAALVRTGLIRMDSCELSIFQVLAGERRAGGRTTLDRLRERRLLRESMPAFDPAPVVAAPAVRTPVAPRQPSTSPAREIRVRCRCGARFRAPASLAGQSRTCPACRAKIVLVPVRA